MQTPQDSSDFYDKSFLIQYDSISISKKRGEEKKESLAPVFSYSHGFNAVLYLYCVTALGCVAFFCALLLYTLLLRITESKHRGNFCYGFMCFLSSTVPKSAL